MNITQVTGIVTLLLPGSDADRFLTLIANRIDELGIDVDINYKITTERISVVLTIDTKDREFAVIDRLKSLIEGMTSTNALISIEIIHKQTGKNYGIVLLGEKS